MRDYFPSVTLGLQTIFFSTFNLKIVYLISTHMILLTTGRASDDFPSNIDTTISTLI